MDPTSTVPPERPANAPVAPEAIWERLRPAIAGVLEQLRWLLGATHALLAPRDEEGWIPAVVVPSDAGLSDEQARDLAWRGFAEGTEADGGEAVVRTDGAVLVLEPIEHLGRQPASAAAARSGGEPTERTPSRSDHEQHHDDQSRNDNRGCHEGEGDARVDERSEGRAARHRLPGALVGVLAAGHVVPSPLERQALRQAARALSSLLGAFSDGPTAMPVVFEGAAQAHVVVDARGVVLEAGRDLESLLGVDATSVLGRSILDLVVPEERAAVAAAMRHVEAHEATRGMRPEVRVHAPLLRLERPGGEPLAVEVATWPVLHASGKRATVVALRDVSERAARQALLETIEQEHRFLQALLDAAQEGVLAAGSDGHLAWCNPAALAIHGLPGWLAAERGIRAAEEALRARGSPLLAPGGPMERASKNERIEGAELTIAGADATTRVVLVNARPIELPGGGGIGAIATLQDITERRMHEQRLAEAARRDPLTGLGNRALLVERLRLAADRATREGSAFGIVLLDLDGFKAVNDGYGHEVGDEVLVAVAQRLAGAIRPSDTAVRYGGDEFVFLVGPPMTERHLSRVQERLERAAAVPMRVHGADLTLSASTGAVLAGAKAAQRDVAELIRQADAAMYAAKQHKREAAAPAAG